MGEVQNFTFKPLFVDIDNDDFTCKTRLHYCVDVGGADGAAADYDNFCGFAG